MKFGLGEIYEKFTDVLEVLAVSINRPDYGDSMHL
jgi:hypothetical protein